MLGAMDEKQCQRWSCRLMSSPEDPAELEKAGCFSGTAWISCPQGASSSKSFVGFLLLVLGLLFFFFWQAVGRYWPAPLLTPYWISERRPGAWAASPLITVQAGLWGLWCGFIPGGTPFFTRSPGRIAGLSALQTCAGLESESCRWDQEGLLLLEGTFSISKNQNTFVVVFLRPDDHHFSPLLLVNLPTLKSASNANKHRAAAHFCPSMLCMPALMWLTGKEGG